MNVSYKQCFQITINHNYFVGDVCTVLQLIPTSAGKQALKRNNLRINPRLNNFGIYCGINADTAITLPEQIEGMKDLFLQVINEDPYFFNYTDLPFQAAGNDISFYTNLPDGTSLSDIGTATLQPNAFFIQLPPKKTVSIVVKNQAGKTIHEDQADGTQSSSYRVNLTSKGMGYYTLWIDKKQTDQVFVTTEELHPNCIGILQISMNKVSQLLQKPQDIVYTIRYAARSTYLQFAVIVDPSKQIEVNEIFIDDESGMDYLGPEKVPVADGNMAQVFTSSDVVELTKVPASKRLLKLSYSNDFSERAHQVQRPLPDPNIKNIKIQNSGEGKSFYCETYVHV